MLDVSLYLVPINESSPSGESLRYEDDYAEIEQAREEEEEGSGKKNRKVADWDGVIKRGLKAIQEKSKDLEIAAWVVEALTRRQGMAGLRDGLGLLLALQETFWETAHPGSGDLELREGIYHFLDDKKRLPLLIRGVPLTLISGLPPCSFLTYQVSREVENLLRKKPEMEEELAKEGKIRAKDFDQYMMATKREYQASTVQLLDQCLTATRALNASIQHHYGERGPILGQTEVALVEVLKLANETLARKPAPPSEPDPDLATVAPSDLASADDSGDEPTSNDPDPSPVARPSRPRSRTSAGGGPMAGPEGPRSRIVEAAAHLRRADPADPLPYLVVDALNMGELYRSPGPIDPSTWPPPASEDRQTLRRLDLEGAWAELLEEAEQLLSGPGGLGWLDARRLALKAMAELGHESAARARRATLQTQLRDYPDWPRAELNDTTPCASSETRAWIEEILAPEGESTPEEPAAYTSTSFEGEGTSLEEREPGEERLDDPWDQAQECFRRGQPAEAVALVARAARDARTGRERFLRTFQQAELCLMMGRPGVATPLLEGLARQIDEFGLDRWEDPSLCGRVVSSLYRCLREKDPERARTVYERLCQLDIGQALSLGDGTDA